jgi:general secretion pathway protein B
MSYILKALKKSQQERDRGLVPRLSHAPDLTPAPSRRAWPWWLGGTAALNAAALAGLVWWLGGIPSSGETTSGKVTAEVAPASPEQQVTAGKPAGVSEAPSVSQSSSQQPSAKGRHTSPTPQIAAPQTDPQVAELAQATPSAPSGGPTSAQVPDSSGDEASATLSSAPSAQTGPPPASMVQSKADEPDPAPTPPVASVSRPALPQQTSALPDLPPSGEVKAAVVVRPKVPMQEPDPDASLPSLRQLPYSIQTALPDLTISVHVFAENPRDRFVIIQRRKYGEGDLLRSDLTLEEIAPSSVVLRYKDTMFRLDR